MNETFWTLLHNAAHWEFELFLMILVDGILLGLCWPFIKKHCSHHVARDRQDESNLKEKVAGIGGKPRPELVAPNKRLDLRSNFILCVAPGTRILMKDGTEKLIENVQVGDYVITHKGRPRKVINRKVINTDSRLEGFDFFEESEVK